MMKYWKNWSGMVTLLITSNDNVQLQQRLVCLQSYFFEDIQSYSNTVPRILEFYLQLLLLDTPVRHMIGKIYNNINRFENL